MKQTKQQVIPIHSMDAKASLGIEFNYLEMTNEYDEIMIESHKNVVHRDDYYVFFFLDAGEAMLAIDFKQMQIIGNAILYVSPGQVHFVSSMQMVKGWYLAIDPMLVENSYKNTFEGRFHTQKPIVLNDYISAIMGKIANLLHTTMQTKPTAFSSEIVLNIANAFIGLIAEQYASQHDNMLNCKSRSAQITYQFKELLSLNFKVLKSPTQYAKKLNYSLSHLNESVKSTTGLPISYWIHHQVILEAKRLLYYTNMGVKEIAFFLGYEDYAYFSRLFSKVVGEPPSAFRRKFHE